MSKFKTVILIILAGILVDFAVENAAPVEIKLFKFVLGHVPIFLVAYLSLGLGLLVGWVCHARRLKRKRQAAAAQAAASAQENQESR